MAITKEQKTILLVEDSATYALVEAEIIRRAGYRVIIANSGEEAVRIATSNEAVSLILMDIELGAGMDGTAAAKQILSVRHIPIVFLTSHAENPKTEIETRIKKKPLLVKGIGMI